MQGFASMQRRAAVDKILQTVAIVALAPQPVMAEQR